MSQVKLNFTRVLSYSSLPFLVSLDVTKGLMELVTLALSSFKAKAATSFSAKA